MSTTKKQKEEDIYERDKEGRIIGEKPEHRDKPGRHFGRVGDYGYTLHPDGSYELAPADRDRINRIFAEIHAVEGLLNSVWDHAEERTRQLHADKLEWFRHISRMVYREENYHDASYNSGTGRLTFKAAKEPAAPARPAEGATG